MSEFRVKEASPAQIKEIAGWLIDDRASDPMFRHVNRTGLHRWLYRRFVAPRYLRTMANTWVLEQDDQMAGYAVVEQRGMAIHMADIAVRPGFDRPGIAVLSMLLPSLREKGHHSHQEDRCHVPETVTHVRCVRVAAKGGAAFAPWLLHGTRLMLHEDPHA